MVSNEALMTYDEVYQMIFRMEKYGGSFVKALAEAFKVADPTNRQKLIDAFPNYVNEYGPNSQFTS
jgi:hypothetical protein